MNVRDLLEMVGREGGTYNGKRLKIFVGGVNELGEREVIVMSKKYTWRWKILVNEGLDVARFDFDLKKEGYRAYEDIARDLVVSKDGLGGWKILKDYVILSDQNVIRDGMVSMLIYKRGSPSRFWAVEVSKKALCGVLARDLYFEWMAWREKLAHRSNSTRRRVRAQAAP